MAMDEATKHRLAEAAAKKKGRSNLMGLDRTLGLVALDYSQENDDLAARWLIRAKGLFGTPQRWIVTNIKTGRLKQEKPETLCPWIRLAYAPNWLKSEFASRWESRNITYFVRGAATSSLVFPVGRVAEFLRFLWPDENTFKEKIKRYVCGYSEDYIQKSPGIGAKIETDGTHFFRNRLATVTEVHYGFLDAECLHGGPIIRCDRLAGNWKVVG